jgi:hypothetical protein
MNRPDLHAILGHRVTITNPGGSDDCRLAQTRTRLRGPEIDSADSRIPVHQDRPENAPAANTEPRNSITAAVAVQHRTAAAYHLWIADNASPDYHG